LAITKVIRPSHHPESYDQKLLEALHTITRQWRWHAGQFHATSKDSTGHKLIRNPTVVVLTFLFGSSPIIHKEIILECHATAYAIVRPEGYRSVPLPCEQCSLSSSFCFKFFLLLSNSRLSTSHRFGELAVLFPTSFFSFCIGRPSHYTRTLQCPDRTNQGPRHHNQGLCSS
jgi:hypothetical protein